MLADSHLISAALAASAAVAAGLFAYVQRIKREPYLKFCALGWCLLTLQQTAPMLQGFVSAGDPLWFVEKAFLAAAALTFFAAALAYTQRPVLGVPLVVATAAAIIWTMAHRFQAIPVPPEFGSLAILLAAAGLAWDQGRRRNNRFDRQLGAAFGILGLAPVAQFYFAGPAGEAVRGLGVLLGAPLLLAAGLMLLAAHERQSAQAERNVLALSELNLAASGLQGGEADSVLAQALDRVLSVVGFPTGAILLLRGNERPNKLVITSGAGEGFRIALQEDAFRDYLVQLTGRLGGLAVFRDLNRDAAWSALEREEMFSRFRSLAITQGLQTVIGISLQSRRNLPGVLLLAAPDRRHLDPSQFRLLAAVGQQMGVAVDNSSLMQDAWRRSEELRVLNEIGQALSSTLEPDVLLEKIYTEMQRLFEMADLYIGIADYTNGSLRFELEVSAGARQPKRSRPLGNHLSEYIIRTRQSVLICGNFDAETKKLGIQPVQQYGSYCGVPLVVHDRVIGVMAVVDVKERMFDQDHLKLLGVLANQAAIAIENARLLREEQARARQLALLNNISRHAIAMLRPDEMLARIAEQLALGLTFDHMGIGLLDQSSKEVVIRAEAGPRKGSVGRCMKLGGSLVGHVAATGQVTVIKEASRDSGMRLVLEDSASSIALPLLFAEQIQGVLYVEAKEIREFSVEEIQILHTLADLISGALHHAMTLEKAREQAVTDGLTGVKTHRYLLETLTAEWKRATRADRPFCLLLADLDRFKFVNDFFGHLEGDLVLKRVGRILEQNCRSSDVIARYGGDEFVILMPEIEIEQSRQLAEKLRACIFSDSFLRAKNVTASIGLAAFPADGSTPQELLQIADASMYLSKHQGGNAVSTAGHLDPDEARQWKRDVLEAYLGVTLKRLFSTGPEAFFEIHRRLEQFSQSLPAVESVNRAEGGAGAEPVLPPAVMETVTSLALAIDSKDPYTQGHSPKVASYSALIAEHLGLPEREIEQIRLGGMLHDLGKVGIPESILNKSGPLNAEEWELMKEHVRFGDKLLEPLHTLVDVRAMVLHHHEMFDGSGYPEGRAGERIPLGARIIAIADAYDTITSDRTYKKARAIQAALKEIERCAGAQFDPSLVRVFLEAMRGLSKFPLAAVAGSSSQESSS
jgi:diguanylate cyclase (GGDEF)-like protein